MDNNLIIKTQIFTVYGMTVLTSAYRDPKSALIGLATQLGYEIDFKKKSKKHGKSKRIWIGVW